MRDLFRSPAQRRVMLAMTAVLALALAAWALGALTAPMAGSLAAAAVGISFNAIPNTLRVPFAAVEFDNTKATQGPALLPYRVLIIGQRRSTGAWVANTLQKVTNADQVLTGAGRGSMLHRMAKAFFLNNNFTEVWCGVLDDNGAGATATGTLTITGPATATGTLALYLGGVLVPVAITSGDVQNTIATNIAAAINANLDLPVTANAATNVVTLTYRHKGLVGNDYDVRLNYQDGDKTPAGVSVAIVAFSGGTTNPVLTTLIAALGDQWFHVWAHPYYDATSLTAIENELLSRAGPMRMIDGLAITSAPGTQSALGAIGAARNSQYSSILAQPGKNPLTPPSEFAAMAGAVVAFYGAQDPARPLQTLPLVGALAPIETDRFTHTERDLNLHSGVATSKANAAGTVMLDRVITTYQTNGAGAADTSYLDATTILTLLYLRYSFRQAILAKYPRHKLAADGTRFGPGQAVITPQLGKAEAVAWFRQMEELGLVENGDQFKNDLVVERDASDPNRLNFLLPPDIINQLIVTAAKVQFRL